MIRKTLLLCITTSLWLSVYVDCSCYISGSAGAPPGEPLATTCNYHGWIFDANSTLRSPAPYCENCDCYEGGAYSCCGYGWRGGPIGIEGCVRVIDYSTCDHVFVDENDETQPCPYVSRIPA